MTDERQLEQYRKMTPAERWEMWNELNEFTMELWERNLDAAEIERRWAVWRQEHDASDRNMLKGFREAK